MYEIYNRILKERKTADTKTAAIKKAKNLVKKASESNKSIGHSQLEIKYSSTITLDGEIILYK